MSVAAVEWVLSTTRSVRRHLDFERSVDPRLIEECIELALQAPTGASQEGWRFLVIQAAREKAAVGKAYREAFETYVERSGAARPLYRELAERLDQVPVLILACIHGSPDPASAAQQVGLYGSILPAAWSLMLALRARGLGATWTSLHLLRAEEVARALGIPDGVTQTVLLPVGHLKGARLRPATRRPAREVTYWDRWGQLRR